MMTKKMLLATTAVVVLAGCKQTEPVKPKKAQPVTKEAKWDAVVSESYPSWQPPKKTDSAGKTSAVVQDVPSEPVIEVKDVKEEPVVEPKVAPKKATPKVAKKEAPKKTAETVDPNAGLREQLERSENGVYYTIKLNDSFWKLSKAFYGTGMKWQVIAEANKGNYKSPTKLVIGQKLFIPKLTKTKK